MSENIAEGIVKRAEVFDWGEHSIKIEVRTSPHHKFVYDIFVYVDGELVASSNKENSYQTVRDYNKDGMRIPNDIKRRIWNGVRKDIAEGYFSHESKRIAIRVEMKINNSAAFRFKDMFNSFGSNRYFIVQIGNNACCIIGKRGSTKTRPRDVAVGIILGLALPICVILLIYLITTIIG